MKKTLFFGAIFFVLVCFVVILSGQVFHKWSSHFKSQKIGAHESSSGNTSPTTAFEFDDNDSVGFENIDLTQWKQDEDGGITKSFLLLAKRTYIHDKTFGIFTTSFIKEQAIDEPRLILFKNKKPLSQITSRRAITDLDEGVNSLVVFNKVYFLDDVVVAADNGNFMRCPMAEWDRETENFDGMGGCILQWNDQLIEAPQIRVNKFVTEWARI